MWVRDYKTAIFKRTVFLSSTEHHQPPPPPLPISQKLVFNMYSSSKVRYTLNLWAKKLQEIIGVYHENVSGNIFICALRVIYLLNASITSRPREKLNVRVCVTLCANKAAFLFLNSLIIILTLMRMSLPQTRARMGTRKWPNLFSEASLFDRSSW